LRDDREIETVVTRWLITKDTHSYQQRTEKLVERYNQCLSCSSD